MQCGENDRRRYSNDIMEYESESTPKNRKTNNEVGRLGKDIKEKGV